MKSRAKKRPAPDSIAVVIEDKNWTSKTEARRLIRKAAAAALAAAGKHGSATILLTGDDEIADMNATFRGRKGPTNVLSFPSDDPDYLGDIAIALGVVKREALAQGKSLAAHAAHLAAHGMLHLLGYDHQKTRDAEEMEGVEVRVLAGLGIADPYLVRDAA